MMTLLSAEHLSHRFPLKSGWLKRTVGFVTALDDVSVSIAAGETVGLVGESGSGKSTLGRMVARLRTPDQGRLLWQGEPAAALSRRDWARRVQMVFQDPSASLNPRLRVSTLLREALEVAGEEALSMAELLRSVGLPSEGAGHFPHQFSGGQKQRLAIARALAARPEVLVADEPVSALDVSVQAQILNLLMDLRERFHLSLLLISHDLGVVARMCDRLCVMDQGRLVEEGTPEAVLSRPQSSAAKKLVASLPRGVHP